MLIICTICNDLINHSENLRATACGHIFHQECLVKWIQRSKTCPQCRNVVTDKQMFRLYPTTSNHDSSENVAIIQSKLEDAQLELREQTAACREKEQKLELINKTVDSLRNDLKSVKEQNSNNVRALSALRDERKAQRKYLSELQEEMESWKHKAMVLAGLQNIINDSNEEVARMLAVYTDIKTVVTLAAALKRLLTESELKKNECRDRLNAVTQELQNEKIYSTKLRSEFEKLQETLWTNEKVLERLSNKRKASESLDKLNLDDAETSSGNDENASLYTLVNNILNADSPYLNLKTGKVALPVAHKSSSVKGETFKSPELATKRLYTAKNQAPKKARTDPMKGKLKCHNIFNENQRAENSVKEQQSKVSEKDSPGYIKLYTRPVAYEIGSLLKPTVSAPKLTTKHRVKKPNND